jgi:glycosyltransferase involved in cell wall biosynthesis
MNRAEPGEVISVVIPTYKSEPNLPFLVERLTNVLSTCAYKYEILFVDDNSPDHSLNVLKDICSRDPRIKVISLSRNFGQQVAISAGLQYAAGDAVIIMDDDLQDPPEFLPNFLEKWNEGYDVVYAVRRSRKENFAKRLGYKMYYRLMARLSYIQIPKDSGDFGLIDRRIINIINSMPERNRFMRGIRAWVGYRQIGIECDRAERYRGRPAYDFFDILKLSSSGVLAFSDLPLRVSSAAGFVISLVAFLGMIVTVIQKIMTYVFPQNPLAIWPGFSTIVLSVLFLGGIQLISIGIMGEYIAKIYNEVKQRPLFLVKETIGFDRRDSNP